MDDKIKPEYDLTQLQVRRMGTERKQFANRVVTLEPDVATVFPDAASVNEALRFLMRITRDNLPLPPALP